MKHNDWLPQNGREWLCHHKFYPALCTAVLILLFLGLSTSTTQAQEQEPAVTYTSYLPLVFADPTPLADSQVVSDMVELTPTETTVPDDIIDPSLADYPGDSNPLDSESVDAAAVTEILRYTFDQGIKVDAQGRKYVVDVTGRGHTGYVQKADNGGITVIAGASNQGKALRFPARCDGAGCPKALIEAADAPALNPGTAPFSYGASILLAASELTTGSNVVQKGLFDTPGGQWKLQVDNLAGRPSCVVQGLLNGQRVVTKVEATVSIVGGWHTVTCRKTDSFVAILVDGVERGRQVVQVGSVSNAAPVRIGAKNLKGSNDQFHGALDNVFFRLD